MGLLAEKEKTFRGPHLGFCRAQQDFSVGEKDFCEDLERESGLLQLPHQEKRSLIWRLFSLRDNNSSLFLVFFFSLTTSPPLIEFLSPSSRAPLPHPKPNPTLPRRATTISHLSRHLDPNFTNYFPHSPIQRNLFGETVIAHYHSFYAKDG